MTPLQDTIKLDVVVLKKWETRSFFGPSFFIRVRFATGRIAEGKITAEDWYKVQDGITITVTAEKRDDEWTVPGFTQV